jgi:hypothetical protein
VVAACAVLAGPTGLAGQRPLEHLDPYRRITYWISEGSRQSGYQPQDRVLAEWALQTWGRLADPAATMVPGTEESATVRIYWVSGQDGLFGEMRDREVDGRFAADVFVHPDTDDLGLDIALEARRDPLFRDAIVFLTCIHELGHAFGLQHTRDFADIMYSFQYGGDFVAYFERFRGKLKTRDDIRTASPFSDGDLRAFKAVTR